MNSPLIRLLLVSACTVGLLQALRAADEKPAVPTPVVDPTSLIVDLRQNTPGIFSYATWQDKLLVSASGLVVQGSNGARGDGGLGRNIEPALDLSDVAYVEVALGVGARNEVPEVTIALNDADGTQVAARVRIDQIVPTLPVWLHVRRDNFTRVTGQDGKDGKMDWSKVAQWHLQGDWTTKKPFHVVFIALRVRK